MLILRDMKESDIEDYVRWFTTETEWGNWDSPWEGHFEGKRTSFLLHTDLVRQSGNGEGC